MLRRTTVALLGVAAVAGASLRPAARPRVAALRGGSTSPEAADDDETTTRRAWLLEQVRRRQERVLVLSRSLAERGLPFADGSAAAAAAGVRTIEAPDWVCAVATADRPLPCLIWGDAEEGCAVVRPRKAAGQWVTLSALNGLRRTEPFKASKLWYDKYVLDLRRFNDDAGPVAAALGAVLDSPRACRLLACAVALAGAAALARPASLLVVQFLASQLCWKHYGLWSPIVHAPLPLKLLLGRQAWVSAGDAFRALERAVRGVVVDFESRALEAGVSPDDEEDEEDWGA